jgi:hypothetical protein
VTASQRALALVVAACCATPSFAAKGGEQVVPSSVRFVSFAREEVTATFIASKTALTAAHVCDDQPGTCQIFVKGKFGKCRTHPQYTASSLDHDIAVCKFTQLVSHHPINPRKPSAALKAFTIVGFGCWAPGATGPDPDHVSTAQLKRSGSTAGLTELAGAAGAGACDGDSGGPVFPGSVAAKNLAQHSVFHGVIAGEKDGTTFVNLFDDCTLRWIQNAAVTCP